MVPWVSLIGFFPYELGSSFLLDHITPSARLLVDRAMGIKRGEGEGEGEGLEAAKGSEWHS